MNQVLQKQAMKLTKEIMQEFYQNNAEPLYEAMHENMFAIGSANKFVGEGKEFLAWGLKTFYIGKVPNTIMKDIELKIVHSDTHTVVIICLFNGVIEGVQRNEIPEKQRLTFDWTYEDNHLQLIHMHMSNSLKIFDETQDLHPYQASKVTRKVKNIINLNENEPLVTFRDTKQMEHMVSPSEIVSIEAFHSLSIVMNKS